MLLHTTQATGMAFYDTLDRLREAVEARGGKVLGPDSRLAATLDNQRLCTEYLVEKFGHHAVKALPELCVNSVAKPSFGFNSAGVRLLRTEADIAAFRQEIELNGWSEESGFVVQELIAALQQCTELLAAAGKVVAMVVVTSVPVAMSMGRTPLRTSSTSSWELPSEMVPVAKLAKRVADLNWDGFLAIQTKCRADRTTEINQQFMAAGMRRGCASTCSSGTTAPCGRMRRRLARQGRGRS